jgi:hypothetical protein
MNEPEPPPASSPSVSPAPASSAGTRALIRLAYCSFRVGLLVLLALLGLHYVPSVLARAPFRDRILRNIVKSKNFSIQSEGASFGYMSPVTLTGLRLESDLGSSLIEIERIQSEYSWLELMVSRPELGTFWVERPKIDIVIGHKKRQEKKNGDVITRITEKIQLPVITADVHDASIIIRRAASAVPPIDLQHINATFRIERTQDEPILRVDPTTLFDHKRLTPQSFRNGLQLVAPLLSNKMGAEGEFSMRLSEFYVPLGKTERSRNKEIRIEGEIEFHRASVALKNTIVTRMSNIVNTMTNYSGPRRIFVQKGTKVRVRLLNGRVYHQGLALLVPVTDSSSIRLVSSGSVGLDETLDLRVSVQLPRGLVGNMVRRISKEPLQVHFRGTLDNPIVVLQVNMDWVGNAIDEYVPNNDQDKFDRQVTGAVDNMIKRSTKAAKPMKPVFMRMRAQIGRIPFFRK